MKNAYQLLFHELKLYIYQHKDWMLCLNNDLCDFYQFHNDLVYFHDFLTFLITQLSQIVQKKEFFLRVQ